MEERLHIPSAVKHAVDRDGVAVNGVDDPVGFEVNFPIFTDADPFQFRGKVSPFGKAGQVGDYLLQPVEESVSPLGRIVHLHIPMDIE